MTALRLAALWVVLFAAYALTAGVDARPDAARASDEPAYLRVADALAQDGTLPREPQGAGFPALIAPVHALGGTGAVELVLAAVAALAFVLGALLARRIVPEPYASAGAAVAGLSPPALAHATAVYPELTAGALLAGAALCAVSARERPRAATVIGGGLMLAALPWLGIKYAVPAAPVAVALAVWPSRARRRMLGIVAAELIVGSLVFYATLNERLYGGPTPYAAGDPGRTPFDAGSAGEYAERSGRLAGLWLDRDYGLLRWAPFLALAFFAAWLLWRSRRERLARVVPARATGEAAAALALGVCAGQVLVAAFGAPTMYGESFPGRQLAPALPLAAALCAWGLRHAPRLGATLAALTVGASAWLVATRDAWSPPASAAPWGPLDAAFPDYRTATTWGIAAAALTAAALLALAAREHLAWRRTTGLTRRA